MARSRLVKSEVEISEITLKEFKNCIDDVGFEDF